MTASISPISIPNSNVGVEEITSIIPFLKEFSTTFLSLGRRPALCTPIFIPCFDEINAINSADI